MRGGVGAHRNTLAKASCPCCLPSFPGLIVMSVANLCFKSVYRCVVTLIEVLRWLETFVHVIINKSLCCCLGDVDMSGSHRSFLVGQQWGEFSLLLFWSSWPENNTLNYHTHVSLLAWHCKALLVVSLLGLQHGPHSVSVSTFNACSCSAAVFMPCFPLCILCSPSSVRCGDPDSLFQVGTELLNFSLP